jgi:hypothetical protein
VCRDPGISSTFTVLARISVLDLDLDLERLGLVCRPISSIPSAQQRQMIDDEGGVYWAVRGVVIDVGGGDDVLDSPGLEGRVKV